jgi:O-antigen/teichoic acid export membrane protein
LRDTGFSVVGQVVGVVFGLASSIVIARVLGAEQRGVLAIAVLLPLTVHAMVASGFSATVVHSIASKAWNDSQIIPRLFGLWVYLTAIMLAVGSVALNFHEQLFRGTPIEYLIYSASLMPATLLHACTYCILSGKSAFRYQMYSQFVGAPIGFLLTIFFVWWLNLGVVGAITAQLVGIVLSIVLNLYWVPGLIGSRRILVWPEMDPRVLGEAMSFGIKSHIAYLSTFLNYKADQLIVNGMLGSSSVGIYTVAVSNAEKLWLLIGNFAKVLFPTASAEQDDPDRLARFTARLAASMLLMLALLGIVLMLVAEFVIVVLYGEEFREAGDVVVWLVPGIVCLGHAKILANYIAGIGYPGINAIRGTIALVLNVIANIVLIPMYGIVGAALATTVSYIFTAVASYLVFLRIAEVDWRAPLVPPAKELFAISRRTLQKLIRDRTPTD